MTLAKVRDFVGQHSSQFILSLSPHQEPIVNTDDPSGYSKSVQGWIVDDHQIDAPVLQLTVRYQCVNQVFQIIEEQGVIYRGDLAPKFTQPCASKLIFELR